MHLRAILQAAGLSSRPEYYSGRDMSCGDISVDCLKKTYTHICLRAIAGQIPMTAGDAFLLMVNDMPVLTATPFVENMHILARRDWTWVPGSGSTSNVDVGPDGPQREAVVLATILLALQPARSTPEQDRRTTQHMKLRFFFEEVGPPAYALLQAMRDDPAMRDLLAQRAEGLG